VSIVTTGTVLTLSRITPVPGPESALSARMCAAITLLDPSPPLTIVAEGDLALLLPAIALSQRSARRRVGEYVLVDPELPPVTDGWPDAPVALVTNDVDGPASRQGRLRGWRLLTQEQWAQENDGDAASPA
jgi:hypothetical protein